MIRKYAFVFVLCIAMLLLISMNCFTHAETIADILSEKVAAELSKEGIKTKGIRFAVHDAYYDGSLFLASVTMFPNEEGYFVGMDVMTDGEPLSFSEEAKKDIIATLS